MTAKNTPKKRAAGPLRAPRKPRAKDPDHGTISKEEITPLILEAKAAFAHQCDLGNVADSMTFEDWRKKEVYDLTGRAGISKLDGGTNGHFLQVLGHFQLLAGREAEAMETMIKSGKVKEHGPEDDTYPQRKTNAALIRSELARHVALATTTEEITDPAQRAAREAIDAAGAHIGGGYVLQIARHASGTALRNLDELEERLTAKQLRNLLSTVRNRIAQREGRGDAAKRNERRREKSKAQREAAERRISEDGPSYDRTTDFSDNPF